MANIVILGAGIGGLPCAYEMRDTYSEEHTITLINERDHFQFTPSNPWVAVGWRSSESISVPLAEPLKKKGVEFIHGRVNKIVPEENFVLVGEEQKVEYDYLVISTGPRLAFEEVEGLGPEGYTQSVCKTEHAAKAYDAYLELLDKPGPVIIGAAPLASCFGPAYEFAMIIDTALKKAKKRKDVPMTFVTSEPYIGHLGLGGVGDSKGMLESELRTRHINWITNAKTTRVEDGMMYVDEYNDQGEVIKQHELPFNYSMMLPAFKGVDAVAEVEGLCNPRGFVNIDEYQRNPQYPNIYSAGVCVSIPPVEATPVPTGAPKTGYMIETMSTAIVHNIQHAMNNEEPEACGTWSAICLADMGDTGAAFVAIPQIPPRNVTWFKKGKWVHQAKIAFEKYFLRKMRKGEHENFWERVVLKSLGLTRLE